MGLASQSVDDRLARLSREQVSGFPWCVRKPQVTGCEHHQRIA
jgi:hypothetical protein